MKIEIVPVAESISSPNKVKQAERGGLGGFPHEPSLQEAVEPAQFEVVEPIPLIIY